MDSIQEAMRDLMRRGKENKNNSAPKKQVQKIIEAVEHQKPKRAKRQLIIDLLDQVYSTLADAGENEIYAILGGKGKYDFEDVLIKEPDSKYDDYIINVRYRKEKNEKSKDEFFAEAKRVAEKFGLETSETEKPRYIDFNIFVPQDEPVYFDLIPEKFRAKIATQNAEDFDNLPVSKNFEGVLKIEKTKKDINVTEAVEKETILKDGRELKVLKETMYNKMLVVLIEGWNHVTPWVIAVNFDYANSSWSWGHYYSSLEGALNDWKKYDSI